MNKFLFVIALFLVMMQAAHVSAQCPAGRYVNEIFPHYTLDSVTYSDTFGLKMDIYQPAGDSIPARPLIILAHGGSFVEGTREDDVTIDSLCVRFAKRGYVTVSIDYRLGNLLNMLLDSSAAIAEVIQAMSDGKAAIRYFVKDKATANRYKIDTNSIYIGGNSAGAVLYMHVGYVESIADCPADIVAAMGANGGFEGNSGNAGYTTRSKAIIDLAGGLNETSFVVPGDKPSVNAQGSLDSVVPYTCGLALDGAVNLQLCGLGSLEPVYDANGIYHMSLVFPGEGHVPWSASPSEFNSVDSMITIFLYNLTCTDILAVNNVNTNAGVSLFPNPVNDLLNIQSTEGISEIIVMDETGRAMLRASGGGREACEINTSRLGRGIYFVKIIFAGQNNSPVVKRIVLE
jgi:hypothetical protein